MKDATIPYQIIGRNPSVVTMPVNVSTSLRKIEDATFTITSSSTYFDEKEGVFVWQCGCDATLHEVLQFGITGLHIDFPENLDSS